jgi:hypothetical protein
MSTVNNKKAKKVVNEATALMYNTYMVDWSPAPAPLALLAVRRELGSGTSQHTWNMYDAHVHVNRAPPTVHNTPGVCLSFSAKL